MKQAWECHVKYHTHSAGLVTLQPFVLFSPKMDMVYRYLQRKFLRVATKIESIEVKDRGYLEAKEDGPLELVEWDDGSISARHAGGAHKEIAIEKPTVNDIAEACSKLLKSMGPSHGGYQYVPPPPREQFPALTTYPVFEKVGFPVALWDRGGNANWFKSKFYDVFPREK